METNLLQIDRGDGEKKSKQFTYPLYRVLFHFRQAGEPLPLNKTELVGM